MAAFYHRKRDWNFSKSMTSQAINCGSSIPTIEGFSEQCLRSFDEMLRCDPFGVVFNISQKEDFNFNTDFNANFILFRSIMLDLLICNEEWNFSQTYIVKDQGGSKSRRDEEEDGEEGVDQNQKKKGKSSKTSKDNLLLLSSVFGETTAEKLARQTNELGADDLTTPDDTRSNRQLAKGRNANNTENDDDDFFDSISYNTKNSLKSDEKNPSASTLLTAKNQQLRRLTQPFAGRENHSSLTKLQDTSTSSKVKSPPRNVLGIQDSLLSVSQKGTRTQYIYIDWVHNN